MNKVKAKKTILTIQAKMDELASDVTQANISDFQAFYSIYILACHANITSIQALDAKPKAGKIKSRKYKRV